MRRIARSPPASGSRARRTRVVALATLLVAAALAGCAEPRDPPAGTPPSGDDGNGDDGGSSNLTGIGTVEPMAPGEYTATIVTSKGTFKVELWEDKAPLSVANFLQYAEDGHYDGTVFHRVVKGFVIQGGGFASPFTGDVGPKATHGPIPQEQWRGTAHEVGTLAMARTQDPNSATAQWFVNTARNSALDSGYTVFGKVLEGMDVVRAIEDVPTVTRGQFKDVPAEDVIIQDVTVSTPDVPATPSVAAFTRSYSVTPGGSVSFPVFVKNVGGERLDATLAATATNGATTSFVNEPGTLSAGHAGVAIVRVETPAGWSGGTVTVTAASGATTDGVTLDLKPLTGSPRVAGNDHPRVSVYYLGLYDNGVVFDTTYTGLKARGFALPGGGWSEHPAALKVWVGERGAETGDYTPVIPGFAAGVIGLKNGETRTQRLTPEEGYRDGNYRIFEMTVKSIDG